MNSPSSPHLRLAHRFWAEHLRAGGSVVDATCGNGRDLTYLAELIFPPAEANFPVFKLFAYDVQEAALRSARERASASLSDNQAAQIRYLQRCHSQIGRAEASTPIALIVYNLGYLPGGDKTLTTKSETTALSLRRASELLMPSGALSIMCYPRHEEGHREWRAVRAWLQNLPPAVWSVQEHCWLNRPLAPLWYWAQRTSIGL